MKSPIKILLVVSAAILAGCQHRSDSDPGATVDASADSTFNDAIRTAIQAHLAHNTNLSLKSFDTEVKQVKVDGDHAQALVEFHVKNGPGSMQLTYALTKKDGAWVVTGSMPVGSNFSHPALDKAQASPAGGTAAGDPPVFHVMDNLHGRTAAGSQNLPPGHPPVAAAPKDPSPQAP
jgi:hypothetical protein